MTDGDSEPEEKKRKVLHFGSLEEKAKQITAEKAVIEAKPTSESGYFKLDDLAASRENELLAEFERRKRIKQTSVPTDDHEVRMKLRSFQQPITYFGEGPAERRERLREILADVNEAERIREQARRQEAALDPSLKKFEDRTWYHEGTPALKTCRMWIADYSLPRASKRLGAAREKLNTFSASQAQAKIQDLHKNIRSLSNSCSQVGDPRPLTYACFSPNGAILATTALSGNCKLWNMPSCTELRTLKGHDMATCCIAFHPHATISLSNSAYGLLASSDHGGGVKLWSLESDSPVSAITGHDSRVSRLAYHPSGRFIATACYDNSWRLWDLTTQEELLYQEGHNKPVHDLAFQTDGSLIVTASLDCYGRVWDLRTGRCIMIMEGHQKSILSVDFSVNGYEMVTGSEDNTIKVWDVRTRKSAYTIPAHNNLVSQVKFEPRSGEYIASSSFDKTLKIWSHPNWTPLVTLGGHESYICSFDINSKNMSFVTASRDRTFKLWTSENTTW